MNIIWWMVGFEQWGGTGVVLMKKKQRPSTYIFDALSDLGSATSTLGEDHQRIIFFLQVICHGGGPHAANAGNMQSRGS
jgi:hypothetical protein